MRSEFITEADVGVMPFELRVEYFLVRLFEGCVEGVEFFRGHRDEVLNPVDALAGRPADERAEKERPVRVTFLGFGYSRTKLDHCHFEVVIRAPWGRVKEYGEVIQKVRVALSTDNAKGRESAVAVAAGEAGISVQMIEPTANLESGNLFDGDTDSYVFTQQYDVSGFLGKGG